MRYYLQQSGARNPQKAFILYFSAFPVYIVIGLIYNSIPAIKEWTQLDIYFLLGHDIFNGVPIVIGVVLLILTFIKVKRNSQEVEQIDVRAIIARVEVQKIFAILLIRIIASCILIFGNIILSFTCQQSEICGIIDKVLELIYKVLVGSLFLIRVNW